jgi:hypothetical protein
MRDHDRSRHARPRLALALGLVLATCKGAAPVQDADAGAPTPSPASDDGVESPPPVSESPPPSGCNDDTDCSGGICEGEGCGPGEGTCQPRDRMCTRDLRPYCGCDGHTFQSSGSCPGKRFAHRGACEEPSAN